MTLTSTTDAIRPRNQLTDIPTDEFRCFIRWAFVEIADPQDAENVIRAAVAGLSA